MPKIHRIRIVGLKYDGMQKQYRDTTFDFHNEMTSTNGLIAMMNGGGKGVFLQTIFQVLKPGTAWGKQNNRYYQQFFFNKKEQFVPYTFHVLIQWELDGSDERHLVTGGMFSAEQRISMNEESSAELQQSESEAKIIPNITFYAREFERKEDVELQHIPLYENNEVANSDELKDYFKWNGYDVYKDTKKHYRILDTYGINRKDWDIMKDINKDEGGVGKYFEGAEDDHSLFQKRIIPTISQVLNKTEHQNNDLIDIFKSQASIAKDLPILLKREQAHREFLEDIVPFEHQISASIEHERKVSTSTKEGKQLLSALDHVIELEKQSLIALEIEIKQLNERLTSLRFEKDNLEYAKAYQDVQTWTKQLKLEQEKHQKSLELVEEKKQHKESLAFALLMKEWTELQQTITSLSQQISTLEQNSGLEQVNLRMDEIKQAAIQQWEKAFEALQNENNQYHQYQAYIQQKGKELSHQDRKKTKQIVQLDAEIDRLYKSIHLFSNKENELVQQFGDRVTYDLAGLIDSFIQKKETKVTEIASFKQEEKVAQSSQNALSLQLGTLRQSIEHLNEKKQQLNESYEEQIKKEEEIVQKLKGLLDDAVAPLTPALLAKYVAGLESLLQQNLKQTETLKQELWELQNDLSLNDESFWISNSDVKELKERIDESTGIDVFYGSQFIQSLTEEERQQQLEQFPMLPYGLIVSKHQWNQINQNTFSNQLFKSPVPIFLREDMTEPTNQPFVVLNGAERGLLTNKHDFMKWTNSLAEQMEEKKEILFEQEKTELSLRQLMKEIDRLQNQPLGNELIQQIDTQEQLINQTIAALQQTEKEETEAIERQNKLKDDLLKAEKIHETVTKDIALLTAFEQEKKDDLENQRVKEAKEKHKELLVTEQKSLEKELQQTIDLQSQWNQTYIEWKLSIEQAIKEIQPFVEHASFPPYEKGEITQSEVVPQLSLHVLSELNGSLVEWKQLQKSKEEQAHELLAIQATIKAEQKQQAKLEKKLHSLNSEWQTQSVAEEPLRILEELHQAAVKEAKEADKEERQQGTAVTVAETSLNHAKEQSEKMAKKVQKHEREPEPWEDLDLEVKETEIKDQTKVAKSSLKKAEKKQKDTEANISGHEGDKLTLSVILKDEPEAFEVTHLEKIEKEGKACILTWCDSHQQVLEEKQSKHLKLEQSLRKLKQTIEAKDWEIRFRNEVLTTLDHMDTRHYEHIQTIIANMKRFSYSGLEQLDRDKERAERAQDFWASRASLKVMSIADSIRTMIAKMKMTNERHPFPLVQLKDDILPKQAEEIEPLLKQHFVLAIEKITAQFENIDDTNRSLDLEIKQLISDEQIVFVALRNRYPELLVYNMRTDNAFMYGKPQKEHYSTWQTINQGSRTKSDGSGGQKLSARMVMMMMLLSVKSEHDANWVPLVCDNPFGQAASAHVLDPIFAVADKLRFQLIVVTPPELVKTEISQRFDAYYKLDFIREKGKEFVNETVVPAYRIYQAENAVEV